ncbi:MAG TPA: HAD family phosphatase [Micromonosporaceae bacterium]|nr:HAD family phosphatase [Micromonosporaceae bacterium]
MPDAARSSVAGIVRADASLPRPRGLLVDWGGVLTTNVFASFDAFCAVEGLEPDRVRDAFVHDPVARDALVGLELGTLAEPDFESVMAGVLRVDATNLIERLMGGAGPDEAMIAAVRRARAHGIATGLISNSWGASRYDGDQLSALFDGVVISGRVGLRKPASDMYVLGAEALHLQPTECVFVDDLRGNLKPARELGMTTVHHVDASTTIRQLTEIFGVDLG